MNLILITWLSPLNGWKVKNKYISGEYSSPDDFEILKGLGFSGNTKYKDG